MTDVRQRIEERRLEVALQMLERTQAGSDLAAAVLTRLRREGITTLGRRRASAAGITAVITAAAALLAALLLWRGGPAPGERDHGSFSDDAATLVRDAGDVARLPPGTTAVRALGADTGLLRALAALPQLEVLELGATERYRARDGEPPGELGAGTLAALARCARLVSLTIDDLRVAPDDVRALRTLPALRRLRLRNVVLRDEHLHALAQLAALERLRLEDLGDVTDAGLAALPALTRLRALELVGFGDVTAKGYAALAALHGLEELDLSRLPHLWAKEEHRARAAGRPSARLRRAHTAADGDALLAIVGTLTELRRLQLVYRTGVSDAGLPALGALRRLRELDLSGCAVTDAGLATLPRSLRKLGLASCPGIRGGRWPENLRRLEEIVLSSNRNLGDAELARLVRLPALRALDLRSCPSITTAGARELARATGLRELLLCGSPWVDDDLLRTLAGLAELRVLAFTGLPAPFGQRGAVTGTGLAQLRALTRLEVLRCAHNREIPAASLRALRHLPLRVLDLSAGDLEFDAETPDLAAVRALWPDAQVIDRDRR